VRLDSLPEIPSGLNALIMVKPSLKFSDEDKRKLDQYVMHGGNLICLIDNLYAEMDSLRSGRETVAYDRGLNLDDLLFRYGVRLNQDLWKICNVQASTLLLAPGWQTAIPTNALALLSLAGRKSCFTDHQESRSGLLNSRTDRYR
jgi:ABC-type uncharacterized transport system involved in gliding motility auxiliary subunit